MKKEIIVYACICISTKYFQLKHVFQKAGNGIFKNIKQRNSIKKQKQKCKKIHAKQNNKLMEENQNIQIHCIRRYIDMLYIEREKMTI